MRRRVHEWTEGANPRLIVRSTSDRSDAPKKTKKLPNGTVLGLDLSLTNTGMAAIPIAWDQKLESVVVKRCGYELDEAATPRERIERATAIADSVYDFCRIVQARHVYVEDHAYGAGGARATETIEMTGIVKARLFDDWGVVVIPVNAASARKTLLQKLPSVRGQKKGFLKKWVLANIDRLGGPTSVWTPDQKDGFVIANHGVMVVGGTAMTFLGT